MFDITAFIREKIFRRKKIETEKNLAWEELSEKQTTKLWYFFSFLMFISIIWSWQRSLWVIHDMVDRPNQPPYCVEQVLNVLEKGSNYEYSTYDCNLISLENPKFNLKSEFDNVLPVYRTVLNYRKSIRNLEDSIRSLDYEYSRHRNDYNTALLEDIASNKTKIYDTTKIQNTITRNKDQIIRLEWQIKELQKSIIEIVDKNREKIEKLKLLYKQAEKDYRKAYLWYKFKIAVLSFLFVVTIFAILYKIYVKQKRKNSPYTIIFSIATFAYGLLFLEVSLSFLWDLIPHEFLEWLGKLLNNFMPLLYIVQFLFPIIIIAIFWGLIYKIQKRLYSPENVLKRLIKDEKCPKCWNHVDISRNFCPLCQNQLREKCYNCNHLKIKGMPYCEYCWKDREYWREK